MVSYIKTQWWRLLIALFCLVMACVYALKPAPEVLTVEALDEVMTNMFTASLHFIGFVIWSFISFISFNDDRIKLLEKEKERNDAMYDLVQELVRANQIDREQDRIQNLKIEELRSMIREGRNEKFS